MGTSLKVSPIHHVRRAVQLSVVGLLLPPAHAFAQAGSDIQFAVLPLPEQMRAAATVMTLDVRRQPVILRKGSNNMVCMRWVPGEEFWDARCYDKTVSRVIVRVEQLVLEGLTPGPALRARLDSESRAGTLAWPPRPTAGYRVLGPRSAYDPETHRASPSLYRWQSLHVPFATAAEMGLPDESTLSNDEKRRTPYVMASGTWWSHVMIEHTVPDK
jgi:hypothetical protein